MAPKRFLSGVSNVPGDHPLAALPYLDPTKYSIYYQDFFSPHFGAALNGGSATYDGIIYTADANTTIDVVQDADANGCLSILTTAADNDLGYGYTVADSMRMRAGKKFFMEARFEPTVAGTIGQEEIFIGLADSASIAASVTAFMATAGTAINTDDCVGFLSYDGSAEVNVVIGEADVRDTVPLGTAMVTATWYKASIYFDGTDLYYFVNDSRAGAFTPTAIPVSQIGPLFWFKNGEAQIKTLKIDYLFVAAER